MRVAEAAAQSVSGERCRSRFIDQELAGSGYAAAVGGLQPPRYQSQRQESTVATLAESASSFLPTGGLRDDW